MKRTHPLVITLIFAAILLALGFWFFRKGAETSGDSSATVPPAFAIKHPPREFVPDWDFLNAYQNKITAERLRSLLENVYTVGDTWKEVIQIEPDHATIATASGSFVLALLPPGSAVPEVQRYWKTGPLQSLHIAIDPGHIGGNFAGVEERQFGFPSDKPVREGEMSLQTAYRLKPLLEKMGAKVSLVRSKTEPVTPLRTRDFLKKYREYNPGVPDGLLMPHAARWFYRRAEIVARAHIVNEELKPDLVLCLHYNASSDSGAWIDPAKPILVEENHYHMILNGAYTSEEILDEGERFQMMVRILQGIHEHEAAVAAVVADVFAERTGLPAYQYDPLSKRARNVNGHPYLWARNLLANRSYTCPILYFEPWVMNHAGVYARVQAGDYDGFQMVAGKEQPSIMVEYANAVAAGVARFYESEKSATLK